MNLSLRLKTLYDMVPDSICMDVGADHGKLIISLVENNRVPFGYAVENKQGPYEKLVQEINKSNSKDKIQPIFADGIAALTKDVKTVILAGMGGHLIVSILQTHKDKLKNVDTILIDAHNDIEFVRRSLIKLGYGIKNERIVHDMCVYYEIIEFNKSANKNLDDLDYEFGPCLRKNKDKTFQNKYEHILNRFNKLLDDENINKERKAEIRKEKERLLEILL